MVYLLEEPYKTFLQSKEVMLFEDTVSRMIEHFLSYGSDPACCDIGHLYRCPCSFNTKAHSYAYILDWKNLKDDEYEVIRYRFNDLKRYSLEALGVPSELPEAEAIPVVIQTYNEPIQAQKRAKITPKQDAQPNIHAATFGKMLSNRCSDLRRLIFIRNRDFIGLRHTLLTVYSSQYICLCKHTEDCYDTLLKELLSVNKMFDVPLREKEIATIAESSLKRHYSYTDEKICELLNITEKELKQLNHICHPVELTEEEIQRRKDYHREYYKAWIDKIRRTPDGELKSVVKRRERNAKIIELRQQGLSLEAIAEEFNLSVRTIRRALNSST